MNKKGSIGVVIIGLIVILLIGLTATNFLFDEVTTARSDLSCSSPSSISDGTKLLCLGIDLPIIAWIGAILLVAVMEIGRRTVL